MLRTQQLFSRGIRAFSTARTFRANNPTKSTLENVNKTVGETLAKGIESAENAATSVKNAVGLGGASGEAKAKASEMAGDVKGEAARMSGKAKGEANSVFSSSGSAEDMANQAKGKASELMGEAKGKTSEMSGKARGKMEEVKGKL